MKLKRLVIDLGYVINSWDEQMVQNGKEAFYDDIMNLVKYNELFDYIDLVDAPDAIEADIPEFLLDREKF